MMLVFALVVLCLVETARTQHSCGKWKSHRNFQLLHSDDECGQEKLSAQISNRVFNGTTVDAGSLPWMAYIVVESGGHFTHCGGSIINENYILTAAHCVNKTNPNITAFLGLHTKADLDDTTVEKYSVQKYLMHKKYESVNKYDIALLRLDRSISFSSPYINYMCLPTTCKLAKDTLIGKKLIVAGWGLTSDGTAGSTLQQAVLTLRQCKDYDKHGKRHMVEPSQLCTGNTDVKTCKGDSGSPLFYEAAGRAIQVAIVSGGPTDCSPNPLYLHTFFTRVSSFIGWILNHIGP